MPTALRLASVLLMHDNASRDASTPADALLIPIGRVNQPEIGGISRRQVYKLIDAGELQRVKIGSRAFLIRQSIDAYIARLVKETS